MKKSNPMHNNKGVAMITVVLLFLILIIMLGAAMFAAVTNQRNSILASNHSEAYYVAESGINLRVAQMSDFLNDPSSYVDLKVEKIEDYLADMVAGFNSDSLINIGNGTAVVTLTTPVVYEDFFDAVIVTITSRGEVDGVIRTLQQDIVVQIVFGDATLMDKAIVSRGSIIMSNNSLVVGAVLSNGEKLMIAKSNGDLIEGPIFQLWDSTKKQDPCEDITALGWPTGLMPKWSNLIFNGQSLADKGIDGDMSKLDKSCFQHMSYTEEPAKIFPRVEVQGFPTDLNSLYELPIENVTGGKKITLPDLSRIPGGYIGYKITGNLDLTSNLTIDLGSFGHSARLKRIVVTGNFLTPKTGKGALIVTGVGRLVIMKDFGFPTAGQVVEWNADVNPGGSDPAKVIFMLKTHEDLLPDEDPITKTVTSSFAKGNVVTWSIANNAVFNASLIAENVNFEWKNAIVKGYIITNGDYIKLKANAETVADIPVWIYAPVAQVNLESGNVLYGSVLSKAVEFVAGNPELLFEDMPPGADLLSYRFYLQPAAGGGTNPDEAEIYFSNIIEVDNE